MTQTIFLTLLKGFGNTCIIFAVTLVCSLPLGLIISFGSMLRAPTGRGSGWQVVRLITFLIRMLTRVFVWVIRGTPLMLQVLIIYYGPGLLDWGWSGFEKMTGVIVAFVINYAAYFSEIFRSGIQGVPRGQYEAGQVLGMTRAQIFFRITLIQMIKRIVPPMSNEIITLVKDTSLARVIAVRELIMEAYTFTAKGMIGPLFYTGLFYLVFNGILTVLFGYLERKLDYFRV